MFTLFKFNFLVAVVACFFVAGCLVMAPKVPTDKNILSFKNVRWALFFWLFWWLSILATYSIIHLPQYRFTLLLTDSGNIFTIAAAVAYCMNSEFHPRQISKVSWVFFFIGLWDLAMPSFLTSAQARVLVIAPSAVISTMSIVILGWAVMVRCGWTAWPFFLITTLYALAQLPGYIDAFILPVSGEAVVKNFNRLHYAFLFLAFGKILYLVAFLGYLLSPDHKELGSFKLAQYWPNDDKKVKMHPTFVAAILGVGAIILGVIVTTFFSNLGLIFKDLP